MTKTKEDIILSMCLTYNHAYVLPAKPDDEDSPLNCALTASEKEYVYRQMKQIFENDIEPYMEFKQ